jgi:thiamine pyrophosphate-dependent acetolactate synthase large subunit-like protein
VGRLEAKAGSLLNASATSGPARAPLSASKAAFPKRPVLRLIGDGAFNYDPRLAALGVCQEHQLPIMIVLYGGNQRAAG